MTVVIEQDTCDVCAHPVDEFEDHGFGRLMIGFCDDCGTCADIARERRQQLADGGIPTVDQWGKP